MRFRLQKTTILILSLLALHSLSQKVLDYQKRRCSGITFDKYVLSETVQAQQREFHSNSFYSNYTKLFDFYKNKNSSNFLRLFNWQYGLFLTLVVLLFITFVVLFLICCCKFQCSNTARNVLFWIFLLLFLIFIALFITAIVFLALSQARFRKASCASYTAAAALLYGNPKVNHQQEFIGYQNFLALIDNYQQEAQNLKGKETDYTQIINAQLANTTTIMINRNLAFWPPYLTRTVTEGTGSPYIPNVFTRSEPGISLFIESEFNYFDQTARDLTESASQARFMTGDLYVSDTKLGLAQLKSDLDPVYKRMVNLTEGYVDQERLANRYLIATFWTFFGIGIIIIVLLSIAICVFCAQRNKSAEGANRSLCCLKTLLIVAAFFAFAFGVCVLIFMAGLGVGSSFCRFLSELNRGGFEALSVFRNVVDDKNNTNGTPVTKISNFIEICMYKNSSGYLPDLFNSTDYVRNSYSRLINLVEGPKVFDLLKNYTNSLTSVQSPAIQSQVWEWALLRDGSLLDNEGIGNKLTAFNTSSKCANQYYAPTTTACRTFGVTQNCLAIDTLASYTAPACVANAAVQTSNFNALKAYISSENLLVSQLIGDLLNSNVASGYSDSVISFRNLSPNVESFKSALPRTLNTTSNFHGSIKSITQCSNLQVEVSRIEKHLCFSYIRPLNILFALVAFATLMLLFLLWALCGALLCLESEDRSQVIVTKQDVLTVSEQELVPKY
jgi:hypothetical protein